MYRLVRVAARRAGPSGGSSGAQQRARQQFAEVPSSMSVLGAVRGGGSRGWRGGGGRRR